jgi:N-acetylmuramoyl-L-alanine amidase
LNFRSISHLGALTLAFALGLASILFSQSATPTLMLLARDRSRSVPIALINDQEFVGLDDLAASFQLSVQESLGAITVSYKGKTIVLTPDQTLASVAGRLISLPAPPSRRGGRWLVPVEFVSRALAPIYDAKLELRKPARLLLIGDVRVPRLLIRYEPAGTSGRLTVDATPRTNSTVSQDNEHITIKFEADAVDPPNPLLPPPPQTALVQRVRLADPVTIVVDLSPRFGGMKATTTTLDNATRLVLDLAAQPTETSPPPQQGATPPAATPAPAPQPPPELPPAFGQPVSAIRAIAIDPGHGGDDEGARGANGVKEKDLALAVARRLKAVLEARLGIRVLLTRDDDRSIPIDERTSVANNNKVDLFASIHASASFRKSLAGASIFYASFGKEASQSSGAHAAERVPAFGGGLREIEMVPWDLAQTRHISQSTTFAAVLDQHLRGRVPLSPHPTDQAPLRVLESANMPAVLIELGYLSNTEQERLIAGDSFQSAFVQAFYDAVVQYRDALQNGGTR